MVYEENMSGLAITDNSALLARYTQLQLEGKAPVLASYRNTRYVITSYKADGLLESLVNRVKSIFYAVLSYFGLMTNVSAARIKLLQRESYEALLTAWEVNPAVTGNKAEAVRR